MRKQPLTTPMWAEEIRVERKGKNFIVITGKNHVAGPVAGVAFDTDLLAQSVPPGSGLGNRRKKPPHIEFANATDDDKLIEFCKHWGPFNGLAQLLSAPDSPRGWKLVVRENLPHLRAGQKSFSGVARLIAEIQSKKPNPERLSQYFAQISVLGEGKEFFEFARFQNRGWPLAEAACQYAQTLVCLFLDEYPPHLHPTTEGPVELPPMDPGSIGKGIKHVLYGFLRLEYLQRDRLGLGVCARARCDDVFAKEREGAVYCGEDCSKLDRSMEYYRRYGRAKRQEKAAASKSRSSPNTPSKRSGSRDWCRN